MTTSMQRLAAALLAALCLPACGREPDPPPEQFTQVIRGRVTYQGKAVPYGSVIFYSHQRGFDVRTGKFTPISIASIGEGGHYEVRTVCRGPVMVCVSADPDMDPARVAVPVGFDEDLGPSTPAPEGPLPPLPHEAPPPPNPAAEGLTPAQRATLKAIHAKYGYLRVSQLGHVIDEGEQTYDIDLK